MRLCYIWQLISTLTLVRAQQNNKRPPPLICAAAVDLELEGCNRKALMKQMNEPRNHSTLPACTPDAPEPCRTPRTIAIFDIKPVSNFLVPCMMLMPLCCGCQMEPGDFKEYQNESHYFKEKTANRSSATVVFPVFGPTDATSVHGLLFAPFLELTEGYYVTLPPEKDDTIKALLKGILQLGPLLLICLLLAFIAGFVGWVMETWSNEKEFNRKFLPGLFDGFWWSFVSMTTVGYGDKSPISTVARIFSILWILIGITICSMFTASLTNAITTAAQTSPKEIETGSKVGIMGGRTFDAILTITKGGSPIIAKNLSELIIMLKDESVDGILLDMYTYIHNTKELRAYRKATVAWPGKSVSYGIGYKHPADMIFYGTAIRDNTMVLKTCLLYSSTFGGQKTDSEEIGIFSPQSGLFYPFLGASVGIIAVIIVFGFCYEQRRKNKWKVREGDVELEKR